MSHPNLTQNLLIFNWFFLILTYNYYVMIQNNYLLEHSNTVFWFGLGYKASLNDHSGFFFRFFEHFHAYTCSVRPQHVHLWTWDGKTPCKSISTLYEFICVFDLYILSADKFMFSSYFCRHSLVFLCVVVPSTETSLCLWETLFFSCMHCSTVNCISVLICNPCSQASALLVKRMLPRLSFG